MKNIFFKYLREFNFRYETDSVWIVNILRTVMAYPEPRCTYVPFAQRRVKHQEEGSAYSWQCIPLPTNQEQISGEGIQHIPESVWEYHGGELDSIFITVYPSIHSRCNTTRGREQHILNRVTLYLPNLVTSYFWGRDLASTVRYISCIFSVLTIHIQYSSI